MYRILTLIVLFALVFFAPIASAESIGGGKPENSTTTQTAETDESIGGGSSLMDWLFGVEG